MEQISNWGNYPRIDANIYEFERVPFLKDLVSRLDSVIPRGNGRCYGDSALNTNIISTRRFNRFLSFDTTSGIVKCQSGVLFDDLLRVSVKKGWFPFVTPGTKFVTIGGAIASDVHGKNHHKEGSFSNFVENIELMLSDGSVVECSPTLNGELFWLTCGGMGLTGIILTATLRLRPVETVYISRETIRANDLAEVMNLFAESADCTYSVAWIDCLARGSRVGRCILMRGEHASLADLQEAKPRWAKTPLSLLPKRGLRIPFNIPRLFLNATAVKTFNSLYYRRHPKNAVRSLVDYESFFYPLDWIKDWNRLYGSRGFTQYQLVLPVESSHEGLTEILHYISEERKRSFLGVLKLFGPQEGILSFPMEGYTLALDFPIDRPLFEFLDKLDNLVLKHGGRVYLTKDARMKQAMFMKSYSKGQSFREKLAALDGAGKFKSLQSKRVGTTN